jgi:hypothetical protein
MSTPSWTGVARGEPTPPLVGESDHPHTSLNEMILSLELHEGDFSFGPDIDDAHRVMLDDQLPPTEKAATLRNWLARHQPCLFGRIAAKGLMGFGFDLCWLSEGDIRSGDMHLSSKIQRARREWKDRAAQGLSHGFLVMFNDSRLARAKPGPRLVEVCRRVGDLYLVEAAPVEADVIYTEAMPLRTPEGWFLFKAGCNIFYTGAHRTLNHDRRMPGGILISVNSPGHLANSLMLRGLTVSFANTVRDMKSLAVRSVGNGGIGNANTSSTSWHTRQPNESECPHIGNAGGLNPDAITRYSAFYHTDVLVPSTVSADAKLDPDTVLAEVWPTLIIDYITTTRFQMTHVNHALFHGHSINEEARYFNPWFPRRAENRELENY